MDIILPILIIVCAVGGKLLGIIILGHFFNKK